ncbi:MAG: RecX family transcriptional regulator [Firmicutes bacterium]|nr:RecX family transcriptional regulator [Bacillota bacterium]MBQ9605412.1 RecX family transcriptional regulator [Bacillota bacterium]
MKITAITQQKKRQNRYNIFIDNEFAFGIDGVDMLYYKLKEGEELTRERYELIMDELVFVKARETALRYIDFKRRTEKEVRQKLREEFNDETIERVIELLKRYRVIDDEEYARLYTADCLKLKGWGARRILTELAARGISRDTAEKYLEGSGDVMSEKAEKLLEKRVKNRISDQKEYKKHMDFLLRRGFDYTTAKNALEKYRTDDIE